MAFSSLRAQPVSRQCLSSMPAVPMHVVARAQRPRLAPSGQPCAQRQARPSRQAGALPSFLFMSFELRSPATRPARASLIMSKQHTLPMPLTNLANAFVMHQKPSAAARMQREAILPSLLAAGLRVLAIDAAQPFDFEGRMAAKIAKDKQLKIGIVGFGTFGQFLAKRLIAAGHKVRALRAVSQRLVSLSQRPIFGQASGCRAAQGVARCMLYFNSCFCATWAPASCLALRSAAAASLSAAAAANRRWLPATASAPCAPAGASPRIIDSLLGSGATCR